MFSVSVTAVLVMGLAGSLGGSRATEPTPSRARMYAEDPPWQVRGTVDSGRWVVSRALEYGYHAQGEKGLVLDKTLIRMICNEPKGPGPWNDCQLLVKALTRGVPEVRARTAQLVGTADKPRVGQCKSKREENHIATTCVIRMSLREMRRLSSKSAASLRISNRTFALTADYLAAIHSFVETTEKADGKSPPAKRRPND